MYSMIPFVRTFQSILLIVIMIFVLSINFTHAQDTDVPAPVPIITAENITRLASVAHIDFAVLDGEFDTGWFAMSDTADRLLVADKNQQVFILGEDGNVSYS